MVDPARHRLPGLSGGEVLLTSVWKLFQISVAKGLRCRSW
jgi:hypothetical protein